jgi:hypothetical protein
MPDPHSPFQPPYIYLILGIASLCLAVAETLTGQGLGRFGRTIERSKDPNKFWRGVAIGYVAGALLIGYFLYLTK